MMIIKFVPGHPAVRLKLAPLSSLSSSKPNAGWSHACVEASAASEHRILEFKTRTCGVHHVGMDRYRQFDGIVVTKECLWTFEGSNERPCRQKVRGFFAL